MLFQFLLVKNHHENIFNVAVIRWKKRDSSFYLDTLMHLINLHFTLTLLTYLLKQQRRERLFS